jgi:ParB-like chromosome segregation protein Spo0J
MNVKTVPVDELIPYEGNAKLHTSEQIDQIAESIEEFGNCDPIAVWKNEDGELEVVEGHGRLLALKRLGIDKVPVIELDHLTDEQRRAYALVHNQTTLNSGFDFPTLSTELASIDGFDWDDFGFDSIAFAVGLSAEDDFDMSEFEDEMEPDASIVKVICRNDTEKERLRELIGETGHLKRMYRVSEL